MAKRTPSAQKRARQNVKRKARNRGVRTQVKGLRQVYLDALKKSPSGAAGAFKNFISAADKAATKGVIHPNKAARLKSRAARKLSQAGAKAS